MAAPAPTKRPAPPPPAPLPTRPPSPTAPAPTAARSPAGPPAVRLAEPAGDVAPGVMELQGRTDFTPPEPIAAFLDGRKKSVVNVRFGSLAGGPIKVLTTAKGKYRVRRQLVPLAHPLFARAAEAVPGLTPSLILDVENNKLTGQVGLAAGEKVENLAARLKTAPDLFGLAGLDITALPSVSSSLEGGSLHLSVKNVRIRLGSAFDGTASFEVIDGTVNFDGNAAINVKGLVQGTLAMKRGPDGLVTGKVTLSLNLPKNFSGEVEAAWDGTSVTGKGKVGYQGEKLSGSVTLYMMERSQAEQLEKSRQAPEGAPAPAAPAGKSKPSRVDYVVFGEGDLKYAFNDWLNGSAHVIVNPKGFVRVIGKITPQKEFTLFPQKDYVKPIFKVEARATYGVPLLADIFIFANVGLDAFANLGPAKFNNIVVEGDYSTDPAEANKFVVSGHLNISAGAGLLLRGEAGAGLEVLRHDIKVGAGVNATAGVKGYVDAKPNLGYREVVAAGQDKKGEFFVGGDIEIAAQPFFGLSGELFVELDTPWWSPLSDKRWTWPLFGKEWPLGGSLGVGAAVDYVFGSGQWPKFDFKPVEFSGEKFMTNLYDGKAETGSGKTVEQKGKWKEKVSAAAQLPPKTSPQGNAKPGKPPPATPAKSKVARGGGKKDGKPADPNARTKDGKTVKQHQDEADRKGKKPPEAGKDVKARVRAELKGKDLSDPARALSVLTATYRKFSDQGLKVLKLQRDAKDPTKVNVIASASLAEVIDSFSDRRPSERLLEVAAEMNPFSQTTTLYVWFDQRRPYRGSPFENSKTRAGHKEHAEVRFLSASGLDGPPTARLVGEVQAFRQARPGGPPPTSRIALILDINRSPCDECAAALAKAARTHAPDISFTINMVSLYKVQGLSAANLVDQTSEAALINMMEQGIQLNALEIWKVLQRKLLGWRTLEFTVKGRRYPASVAANIFLAEEAGIREKLEEAAQEYMKRQQLGHVTAGSGS
jgi:hypothetical protein